MGKEIRVNLEEYAPLHIKLEQMCDEVALLRCRKSSRTSTSDALDRFYKQVDCLEQLVVSYSELLEKDLAAIYKAVMQVVDLDSKIAADFKSEVAAIQEERKARREAQSEDAIEDFVTKTDGDRERQRQMQDALASGKFADKK